MEKLETIQQTIVSPDASRPAGVLSMLVSSKRIGGNVSNQHLSGLSRTASPDCPVAADNKTFATRAASGSLRWDNCKIVDRIDDDRHFDNP
jgi:hypothetical protein